MSRFTDMLWLLGLLGLVALWLKLSRAREVAVREARRQCERHGLQLLDETVGLRSIRLRKLGEHRVFERSYAFEVSIDGDDREPGRLWYAAGRVTGVSLPTIQTRTPEGDHVVSNVVPMHRLGDSSSREDRLH